MVELIIGIDDAGRGPVIGPMILAGVLLNKKYNSKLKRWGIKDSKLIQVEKRKEMAKKIHKNFKTHVALTTPEEIDLRNKTGTNLNWIEAVKAAQIINQLLKEIEEQVKVIIDCPSPNTESWKKYLEKYIDKKENIELIVEHKADLNHIACAAASIIAKVARDEEIEKIKKQINLDFGSGYCHDPITCKALDENLKELEKHGIIRKSWDTWRKAIAKKEQKGLGDF